ncbi:MAG TPA: hypothetical protein VGQ83_14185 [Polyangia bacterium]|jgi:hypothetical protein
MGCPGIGTETDQLRKYQIANATSRQNPPPAGAPPSGTRGCAAPASSRPTARTTASPTAPRTATPARAGAARTASDSAAGAPARALVGDLLHAAAKQMPGEVPHDWPLKIREIVAEGIHLGEVIGVGGLAAPLAGLAGAGLFFISFCQELHDAHVEGDRRNLRNAVAEGTARVLTAILYPGSTSSEDLRQGATGYRAVKGNREGDPSAAYWQGVRVGWQLCARLTPDQKAAVKQDLLDRMPGWRAALQANDHPDLFRRALTEYLNPQLTRRGGH